jgi:hypothetical protein
VTLRLYDVTHLSGTMSFGSALTVTLGTPGQNAMLSFGGTVGQSLLRLRVTNVTTAPGGTWVSVLNPDGTTLVAPQYVTSAAVIALPALPAGGAYTILADPDGASTGNATLRLEPPPDLVPVALTRLLLAWADSAVASSQYSTTGWSAMQAAGPPNTSGCVDSSTAWAPATGGAGPEWLETSVLTAVQPIGVLVHETLNSGSIYQVDLLESTGTPHTIWTGTDTTPCGDWFVLRVPQTSYPVTKAKLFTQKAGWEEIDAVALLTGETTAITVTAGQVIALSWTVQNPGPGEAVPPWTDALYLSTDGVCCTGDTLLGSFTWSTAVPVGGSYIRTAVVTVPSVAAGPYYLIIRADSGAALPEPNESNNDYAVAITVSP